MFITGSWARVFPTSPRRGKELPGSSPHPLSGASGFRAAPWELWGGRKAQAQPFCATPTVQATAGASGWRNVPKAGRLDAGDVVLPVEVSLHVAGTAVVPVQGLHGLVYAPPVDRGHEHSHGPLALLCGGYGDPGSANAHVVTPPTWCPGSCLDLAQLHTCNLLHSGF